MGKMEILSGYKTTLFLDDKGRVTIPVKVREALNLEKGEMMELIVNFDVIMLYIKPKEEK